MRKVLIVVDMLKDFVAGGKLAVDATKDIIDNIVNRVAEYRAAGYTVIFLCDSHEKDDLEFKRFPEHAVEGTPGADVIEELKAGAFDNDIIIRKKRYSGFYNTSLSEVLRVMKAEVIEVCGCVTEICVMDTVGGLANRDYETVVHRNCVAGLSVDGHNFALNRMAAIYGTIII